MPRTKPPKPTEILKLQGTYKKSRHASRLDAAIETLPEDSLIPPCPTGLHERAACQWLPWIKALVQKRVLTPADFATLEIGFRHLSQALYYSDRIAAAGMPDFLDDDELERRRQMDKLFQEATKAYLKVMYEYGSTPAARAALHVPQAHEKDIDPLEVVIGN